ncbi:MAG: penicillin-binding protein 2 [Verrucomicrobiae bacterium]|nr:penicillin-binding protein 2 [Verrucomicrobiae bacterium]
MMCASHNTRAYAMAGLILTAFGLLGAKLCLLQAVWHVDLSNQADGMHERTVKREASRGNILDAKGNILAQSIPVRTVCADPIAMKKIQSTEIPFIAQQLSNLMDLDYQWVRSRLDTDRHYVVIKRKVSEEVIAQIKALKIPGLVFEPDSLRSYPNGSLASHVLGYVGFDLKGVTGVELRQERYLHGQGGWREIEKDNKGREVLVFRNQDVEPRDGYDVHLTIDSVIQHIVENELDRAMDKFGPKAAIAIVLRPSTGEVLALANRPTFDPNRYNKATPDQLRNRAISLVAEPGSTFKVVSVSAALNEGAVSLDDMIDCENGHFWYAGRILHDAHPHGSISVRDVIKVSSNIGAAKIGLKMGEVPLYKYIGAFGFGQKSGIELPGEEYGLAHPLQQWSKLSITRIPMGHEIAVTPLQMIDAMSCIANHGVLMKPQIVKQVADERGNSVAVFPPKPVRRVLSEKGSTLIIEALKTVVREGGTAPKAALEGFAVAGKTGTAYKIEGGVYVNKYFSSFTGFFPADRPEVCILVSLDEPRGAHYGGDTAGPIFREIATQIARYLDIVPTEPGPKPTEGVSVASLDANTKKVLED